jgi:hypothetical protein
VQVEQRIAELNALQGQLSVLRGRCQTGVRRGTAAYCGSYRRERARRKDAGATSNHELIRHGASQAFDQCR